MADTPRFPEPPPSPLRPADTPRIGEEPSDFITDPELVRAPSFVTPEGVFYLTPSGTVVTGTGQAATWVTSPWAAAPTPPGAAPGPFLPPQPTPQPIPPTTPPPSVPPTTAPPAPQRPDIPIPKGDPDSGAQYARLVRIIRRGVKLANRTQAAWDFGQWIGRKVYEKYGTFILDAIDAVAGRGIPAPDPAIRRRAPPRRESVADRLPSARQAPRARGARGPARDPFDLTDLRGVFSPATEIVRPKRKLTRAQRIRYGLPLPSTPPIAPAPAPRTAPRTSPAPRFTDTLRRVLDVLPSPDRRIDRLRVPRPVPTRLPSPEITPWIPTPSPSPITPTRPSVPLPTPPNVSVSPTFPTPFDPPPSLDPKLDLSPNTSFSGPTSKTRTRDCECERPRRRRRGCTNPVVSRRKREKDGRILITTTREQKCPPSKLK